MRALFDRAALVHHHDAIRIAHGGKPMGDDQRGAPGAQAGQCLLHQRLVLGIQRAGRFVEQQDARVAQQGARERDALPLPTRQARAAGAQPRLVALRQGGDEVVRGGGAGGGLHLRTGRALMPGSDVGVGGVVEDHRILPDIGDGIAQGGDGDAADVRPVHHHAAFRRVIQPRHQRDGGGLPGAGRPDEGDRLPRLRGEAQPLQRGIGHAFIGEADAFEGDAAMPGGQGRGIGRVEDAALLVHHAEDARQPREPFLQRRVQRPQRAGGAGGDEQRRDEAREVTQRAVAVGHPPADDDQHARHGDAAQGFQHRVERGAGSGDAVEAFAQAAEQAGGTRFLRRFQAVGAHHAGGAEGFRQRRRRFAHPFLHPARGAADALAEFQDRHDGDGVEQRCDQRHLPVKIHHGGDQPDDRQRIRDGVDGLGQRFPDQGCIGGEAGSVARGGLARHHREVGPRQGPEQVVLDRLDHPQHDGLDGDRLTELRGRLQGRDQDDDDRDGPEQVLPPGGEQVEGLLDDHGIERGGPRHAQGAEQRQGDAAPVPADIAPPEATEQRAGGGVEGGGRSHGGGIARTGAGRYPPRARLSS